jgi:hypothetical protein
MNQLLVTYALLESLKKDNKSILDCYYPLLLSSLEFNHSYNLSEMQDQILSQRGITIPIFFLRTLMSKGLNVGDLELDSTNNQIKLSKNSNKDKHKNDKRIEKQINDLVKSISLYLAKYQEEITVDQSHKLLMDFVEINQKQLISYFCSTDDQEENNSLNDVSKYKYLVEYIYHIEKKNPELYDLFNDLVQGSVIKSILNFDEKTFNSFTDIKPQNKTQLFLDANYLFSVLGLHTKEYVLPALELYNVLKETEYKLFVYDFTIQEMIHVLKGYVNQEKYLPQTLRVNSLYWNLKQLQFDESKINLFIINLHTELNKLGILEMKTHHILDKYLPTNIEYEQKLIMLKPKQAPIYRNHDIILLERALDYRTERKYRFTDCISFVLTSDRNLWIANNDLRSHSKYNSISEVILDHVLGNILFLMNPNLKITLKSTMAAFSRSLFVNRSIWYKFYEVITEMEHQKEITQSELLTIYYNDYIEKILSKYSEQDIDQINNDLIHDAINISLLTYIRTKDSQIEKLINISQNDAIFLSNIIVFGSYVLGYIVLYLFIVIFRDITKIDFDRGLTIMTDIVTLFAIFKLPVDMNLHNFIKKKSYRWLVSKFYVKYGISEEDISGNNDQGRNVST